MPEGSPITTIMVQCGNLSNQLVFIVIFMLRYACAACCCAMQCQYCTASSWLLASAWSLVCQISPPDSSPTPGVFYTYSYNHAHRLRLEKLLYLELPRSPNGFF
jgi:hypothetical protein